MKRVAELILILLIVSTSVIAQWKMINNGKSGYIHDVEFADDAVGWMECEKELFLTYDAGDSWKSVYKAALDEEIIDAEFTSPDTGWLLSRSYSSLIDDRLLKTTDGGSSWHKHYNGLLNAMEALNDTVVFILSTDEIPKINKSTDGGENWTDITPPGISMYDYFSDVFFLNPNIGFLVRASSGGTIKSRIYRTINGGASWEAYNDISGLLTDIYFTDLQNGYGIIDNSFCVFTNSGRNWDKLHDNVYSYFLFNSEELYITSNETSDIPNSQPITGKLLKSTDNGSSWSEELTADNLFVNITVTNDKMYLSEGVFTFAQLGLVAQGTMLSVSNRLEPADMWESIKMNQPMTSVRLLNKKTAIIIGFDAPLHTQYGMILGSYDSGLNWEITLSDNIVLTDIVFADDSTGYYAADASIWGNVGKNGIYKTTNQGKDWSNVFSSGEFIQLTALSTVGDERLWAGGLSWENDREGVIFYSNDNGQNWETVWQEPNLNINSIFHLDENTAWAVGDDFQPSAPPVGILLKYDPANGWFKLPFSPDIPLNNVLFVNEDIGFITGGTYDGQTKSVFMKTTDGGNSWYTPDYPDYWVKDLFVNNIGKGWAVGQTKGPNDYLWKGVILKTNDYGDTWTVETDTLSSPLESIAVLDSIAIAVGGFGQIIRTSDGGWTWVDENDNAVVSNFYLAQNYPNPFNPATTIDYIIPGVKTGHAPSLQRVSLIIYDVLGKKIATLVNTEQNSGSYSVSWDASGYSSGIYFYKLQVHSGSGSNVFSEIKKMVLLK